MQTRLPFPIHLKGRNILQNVIPTVCNIKNMLDKLDLYQGDETILKSWEKRCFSNYRLNTIKEQLVNVSTENRVCLLRKHILSLEPHDLRANVLDIYIIAFVAETYGPGKDNVVKFAEANGISDKVHSANAIWQVGRGDRVYLGLLNDDGSVLDRGFFEQWADIGKRTDN